MERRSLAAIDAATAARLLRVYAGRLAWARQLHPWLDQHELRALWEDAVLDAYLTHDVSLASEATWVCRVFALRLGHFVTAHARNRRRRSLGTDPKILNGINPEKAFLEQSAMAEVLKLGPREQTILIAHLNGYTYAEVAEQVGLSPSRTQTVCQRAIAIVRQRLMEGRSGEDDRR